MSILLCNGNAKKLDGLACVLPLVSYDFRKADGFTVLGCSYMLIMIRVHGQPPSQADMAQSPGSGAVVEATDQTSLQPAES